MKALRIRLVVLVAFLFAGSAWAAGKPPGDAIASAHPLATEAGGLILSAGGNAFDAAVAISAALAVVEPTGSGLGGGGFWLLHRARDGLDVLVDGRERAPLAAKADMFLDKSGKYVENSSRDGGLAAAIPGEPAALAHIAERYGKLPLSKSLAPAIRLAREGFPADEKLIRAIQLRREQLAASPEAAAIFLPGGSLPQSGQILRQPELAATLDKLADEGSDGFYKGDVAKALVKGANAAGGIWSSKDLRKYDVVERTPLVLRYRDLRIVTAPLPSSGGIVMGIVLNILQGYEGSLAAIEKKHVLVESMRRAFHDRAAYLGDPDFVAAPLQLLSPAYAKTQRDNISLVRTTPSSRLPPIAASTIGGTNTTHFSVLDSEGNGVSATLSVNLPFGSGVMPAGTGVFLNNEMDDFVAKPGVPNAYGLVGGSANAIAPGKRPLSSMSPTFIETAQRVALVGTPGGSRIISMVLESVLAFGEGAGAERLVRKRRFHHQYQPDEIAYEKDALSADEVKDLRERGHALREVDDYGNMQVVIWDKARDRLEAASDPRGIGAARVHEGQPAPAAAPVE